MYSMPHLHSKRALSAQGTISTDQQLPDLTKEAHQQDGVRGCIGASPYAGQQLLVLTKKCGQQGGAHSSNPSASKRWEPLLELKP
jgi:hypothetical protein